MFFSIKNLVVSFIFCNFAHFLNKKYCIYEKINDFCNAVYAGRDGYVRS